MDTNIALDALEGCATVLGLMADEAEMNELLPIMMTIDKCVNDLRSYLKDK